MAEGLGGGLPCMGLVLGGSRISRDLELMSPACLWEGPGSSQTNTESAGFLELQGALLHGPQTPLLGMEGVAGWAGLGWVWACYFAGRKGVALCCSVLNLSF